MKKRAQIPDAYTYTLLFRGFARHAHRQSQILERALKIYHSMFSDNSPVTPSIIHTNAVLQICAKANDIDTMFAIAARLPEKGRGAPDSFTFTTVMNAVRVVAWEESSTTMETKKQKHDRRREAVLQGRRMWADVLRKWKIGHIVMDEDLVCAMGRLLLLGDTTADCDDVLSLLEQTMRLPRLLPHLRDSIRKSHYHGRKAAQEGIQGTVLGAEKTAIPLGDSGGEDERFPLMMATPGRESQARALEAASEFGSLSSSDASLIYAMPGPNTLSLVLDACARMRATKAAKGYWVKLTREIEPDLENYHMYLRVLRMSRASSMAVDLVGDMVTPKRHGGLDVGALAKTFRLGMSACNRDSNNPTSLKNGTRLVKMMHNTIETVDLRTMEMFQQLIRTRDSKKLWAVEDMCGALEVLQISFQNAESAMAWTSLMDNDLERRLNTGNKKGFEPKNADQIINTPCELKSRVVDEVNSESFARLNATQMARLVEMECARAIALYGTQPTDKIVLRWQHIRAAAHSWLSRHH